MERRERRGGKKREKVEADGNGKESKRCEKRKVFIKQETYHLIGHLSLIEARSRVRSMLHLSMDWKRKNVEP